MHTAVLLVGAQSCSSLAPSVWRETREESRHRPFSFTRHRDTTRCIIFRRTLQNGFESVSTCRVTKLFFARLCIKNADSRNIYDTFVAMPISYTYLWLFKSFPFIILKNGKRDNVTFFYSTKNMFLISLFLSSCINILSSCIKDRENVPQCRQS